MKLYLLIGVIGMVAASAFAQDTASAQKGTFAYDVVPVKLNDTLARVDVYTQIPYGSLSFIRDLDNYIARYDVSVQFRTKSDSIVKEQIFADTLKEKDYDATIGQTGKFVFRQKVLMLPFGDYNVAITLTDDNARFSKMYTRKLHIPDYAHVQVGMSGILLASSVSDIGGKKSITPYLLRNASGLRDGVFLFFEVYDKKASDTLDAVYTAVNVKGDEVLRSTRLPLFVSGGRTQEFIKLPTQLISQGQYTVQLGLFPHTADTSMPVGFDTALAQSSHGLMIDWGLGVPQTAEDIDKAIEQLRWVANSDQIDSMQSAPTVEEKRARFERFWQRLDPTPGTPRNEAMELYYSRVKYANEHFKSLGDGWASDRGMIYIIFGAPSSEDNHPFDYISYGIYHGPYMIWYYDRYGRQYVFIDQDGFGDFRLASPMPIERFRYGY